ncbi:hypothetical protein DFR58_11422 [Anaerobacterium chartisolvens]|uniref:Uncharacterized protein n=1 Tax=Anaerobacterium chartisolvens TaxID=1297424 RepID=A0A369B2I5_9FIRM|nr:hypothetical protein DFR58_11422 [Anaerobacterium chartisolvens]
MRISGITYVPRKSRKLKKVLISIIIILIAAIPVIFFFFPNVITLVGEFFSGILKTFPFWKE